MLATTRPTLEPSRLGRASQRTGRTALQLANAATHIKRRLAPLPACAASSAKRLDYASQLARAICVINGFDVQVSGPRPRGPAILVCNHVSWQDPILIGSVVPALAIAKIEVESWPLIGELARGLDYLFVDRGRAHSGARVLLRAKTALEYGAALLTFPEGTTTLGHDVLPLHRGVFGLSRITGVPVWPIALRYADADAAWVGDESFLPSFYRTVARPRTVARLDFGTPLEPRADEPAADMAARARAAIRDLLQLQSPGVRVPRERGSQGSRTSPGVRVPRERGSQGSRTSP